MITEKENPIVIIDDDDEDLELINEAFVELSVKNERLSFKSATEALLFLKSSECKPLFILCDVNMQLLSGFELREILHKDEILRLKSIPFLFLSTSDELKGITNAYNLSVQGYFVKPDSFDGLVNMLKSIMEYWTYCKHPNTKGLRNNSLF